MSVTLLSLTVFAAQTQKAAPHSVAVKAAAVSTDSRNPSVPHRYWGHTVMNIPHGFSEKIVAVTFDDGPSPFTTPQVLDSLKKRHMKATFFVVGQMIPHREKILQRIIAEGHVVGNHTNTHPMRPSAAAAPGEISITNQRIKAALGFTPKIFRPPYGNLSSQACKRAKALGFPIIYWTGTGADTSTHNPARVVKAAVGAIRPGAIILLHDIQKHTMHAVPQILDALAKKGYKTVTVPEMLVAWERQALINEKAAADKKASAEKAAAKKPSSTSLKR